MHACMACVMCVVRGVPLSMRPGSFCAGLLAYLEGSPDSWDNCIARGDVVHIPTAVTNNAQNV